MDNFDVNSINNRAQEFSHYINNELLNTIEDKDLIEKLLSDGDVYIFGGIIRDYLFSSNKQNISHRDIDLVATKINDSCINFMSEYAIRNTLFGGYKLKINEKNYDIWTLENTWALKEFSSLFNSVKNPLPDTSFFNITAIVFSLREHKFILNEKFLTSLQNKVLDIVFEPNPLPSLCLIKTYEYVNRYNLSLSNTLKKFVSSQYEIAKEDFDKIQIRHFGSILYSKMLLENFFNKVLAELD